MKRPHIGKTLRHRVLELYAFSCVDCGRSGTPDNPLEIDHMLAVSKGGTNDIDNLTVRCFLCNRGKRDRVIIVPRPRPGVAVDFRTWLRAQSDRNDPIGDFATDAKLVEEPVSYKHLSMQLRAVMIFDRVIHNAAWHAWREYQRGGRLTRVMAAARKKNIGIMTESAEINAKNEAESNEYWRTRPIAGMPVRAKPKRKYTKRSSRWKKKATTSAGQP